MDVALSPVTLGLVIASTTISSAVTEFVTTNLTTLVQAALIPVATATAPSSIPVFLL